MGILPEADDAYPSRSGGAYSTQPHPCEIQRIGRCNTAVTANQPVSTVLRVHVATVQPHGAVFVDRPSGRPSRLGHPNRQPPVNQRRSVIRPDFSGDIRQALATRALPDLLTRRAAVLLL